MIGFSIGVWDILRSKSSIDCQFDILRLMPLAVGVVELLVVDNHNLNCMKTNGGIDSPDRLKGSHGDQTVPSME